MSPQTSGRGKQDRHLPLIVIQTVGVGIVIAVVLAGIFVPSASAEILVPVAVAVGMPLVLIGGSFEKTRREVRRVLRSADDQEEPPETGS